MKINPGYISENMKVTMPQSVQNFKAGSDNVLADNPITSLSEANRDYNVKVPIAYKHVEDIKLSDNINAKCYKLANGQNVIIVPKDGPTIVKSYVNTGSFNEPDNLRGISHYIEHNLFNGSEDLGEKVFFDEVDKMGGNTNASTSFSTTDYYIGSNLLDNTDLENSIKLHAGMLQSPKFLLDKLEKEKKIVNSEINMYMSEDESLGFSQTIKNLYNINSASLDLVAGTTDNISALTREDVVNYFNNNYYPANITTVITGEVNPEDTMKLVSKYFNSNKVPNTQRHYEKMVPIDKPVRQDLISPKSQGGASIFLGFAGPENNNTKDKILLQAVATLAGGLSNSRFSNLEREYGTGINISPERLSSRPGDRNLMMVETNITDFKTEFLLKDLYAVIDKLSKVPPTADELTAIKNRMKKSHNAIFESSYAINNHIGSAFLNNNLDAVKDFDNIVDSITEQDIVRTAKKYLDLNKAALTVVHPNTANADEINKDYKLVSSISFTGTNKKTPININTISKYKASNNFNVVLNDVNSNNVEYSFTLSEKEWTPKKAAIANVLSDMLKSSGTNDKTIEECSRIEDILGLDCSISVSDFGISAGANFPVSTAEKSLKHLNELIRNPKLDQENFEASIKRLRDYYSTCEVSVYDKFDKAIWKGTPAVFTPKDKLESLNGITLEDVKVFYSEIFEKSMGSVVVTGPFSKNSELKNQIFNAVNEYSSVQPYDRSLLNIYTPIVKTEVYTDINKKNQAEILEGFKFNHNGNIKDKKCVELLNEILGGSPSSRLFTDLRESRHLAYSVSSDVNYSDDIGVFTLSIGTTTENQETGEKTYDNLKKSIDGFNENISKIMTQKVTPEELENAKKRVKSSILNALESNFGKNIMIEHAEKTPYGVNYLNKSLAVIDSITVDDIYNTAKYIFKEKPVYSITATQPTLDANKEFLDSLSGSHV